MLVVLFAVSACSSKKSPHKTFVDAGNDEDAGSGTSPYDADVPLPVEHDSGMAPPGMPAQGLTGNCAIDTNKIFTVVQTDKALLATPLAVDLELSQFALPYVGEGVGCFDAVYVSTLAGASTAPKPASKLAIDACANERPPGITSANGRWLLALIDNRQRGTGPQQWDLWTQAYNARSGKATAEIRISDTPAEEKAVAIQTLRDGTTMVAWVDTSVDGASTLRVRALDATGKPTAPEQVLDTWNAAAGADLTKNPKLSYGALAMSSLGADGAGLGYWRYDPANTAGRSEIVFVALDKKAKPVRSAWVISSNAGPAASVDVESNETGGGIVYTQSEGQTGRQLWFQQIDDTGQAAPLSASAGQATPLRFLEPPFRGIDVSVTKLRSQYAIVYRELPRLTTDKAQIRIIFLDRNGGKLGDSDISYTSEAGGKTAIRTAYDGRTVIAWTELNAKGQSVVKVVRLPCVGG